MTTIIRLNKVLTDRDGAPRKTDMGNAFTLRYALVKALDEARVGPFGVAAGILLRRIRDTKVTKLAMTALEIAFLQAIAMRWASNAINVQIANELAPAPLPAPAGDSEMPDAEPPISSDGDF